MTRVWSPAAIAADETTPLFSVHAGERVVEVVMRPMVNAAAATSTASVGDGTSAVGYLAATNLTSQTTPVDGVGAYLANAGGKLYLVDDTIDVAYVNGTEGAVLPVMEISAVIRKSY